MISPFTPDEIDLVSRLLRSRYPSDTTVEKIDAEVQLDPADAAIASFPGLYQEAHGAQAIVLDRSGPVSVTISRQPTWEVHHPEGLFVAHRGD